MPTLYMDYEGGNDNYGGTSFNLLASGSDGAITSSTFSSATASFPNDGSLIGQYLSIFNGTIYAVYSVTAWVSSTSLTIAAISGGTALADQTSRQYYIGGRWQTLAGATAVRTIPGDTVRVMASPNPTSIGSATWTGGGRPAAVSIASSTNATPIAITTSTAHGLSVGDYVAVIGHATNTNANGTWQVGTTPSSTQFTIVQLNGTNTTGNGTGGATGNVTKVTNCVVKTSSPLVQNIALSGGLAQKVLWTAATGAASVARNTTDWKEGYSSLNITLLNASAVGRLAYYTLPATLDLSSYQQVSFWVNISSGAVNPDMYLALCTDTVGSTVAHQCNIPSPGTSSTAANWRQVTVDFGTSLNSAIRSVAFYSTAYRGAVAIGLDNIVACKSSSSADSVTLSSLISKSSGSGDEAWYAIESINGDVIVLANANSTAVSTGALTRGYIGTTETVTTYKRETLKTGMTLQSSSVVFQPLEAGTEGSSIAYSGGWDRTAMSTQSGQTWFDGANGLGVGWTASLSFVTVDRLNFVRYSTGFSATSAAASGYSAISMYATACSTGMLLGASTSSASATNLWLNNCTTGLSLSGRGHSLQNVKSAANCSNACATFPSTFSSYIGTLTAGNYAGSTGNLAFSTAKGCVVGSYTCSGGGNAGIYAASAVDCFINSGSTSDSTTAGVLFTSSALVSLYLNNFTINETTEISSGLPGGTNLYSNRHDNADGNNWQWLPGLGTINQQTAVVDSPATAAWKLNPTTTSAVATSPVKLKLGTVVCAANSLVTVTARMRRDDAGLTMRLICPGGQISGVSSDVSSDMTAAANAWETVTITFTPTKAGGVDIWAYAFGGTTFSGYVCNLTASQA